MDPLHAYEEGVNHEALMAYWRYGDPVYLERCMLAARSTEALTTVNAAGHRHFKSQLLGAEDLRIDRKTDTDGHAHPLMLHPAFEVAWYNRNPRAVKLLRAWGDAWLAHLKPGEWATSVDVASDKATDTSPRPVDGGYGSQASALIFLYQVTGDAKYLRPFSDAWHAGTPAQYPDRHLPELWHVGALAGLGDLRPLAQGKPMFEALVTGTKDAVVAAVSRDIAELQRFPHLYTGAEVFTDRVFLNAITNATIAYTGGYATRNKYNHTHAVSYAGFGTDYAALVQRAAPDGFKVLLYSFAEAPRPGRLTFWALAHGRYRLTLGPDADGDDRPDRIARDEVVVLHRGASLPVTLPPRQAIVLELRQQQPLDDLLARPDLAVSPLDLKVEGGAVTGFVHNIGAAPSPATEVVLVDAAGKAVARQAVPPIEAPLDLVPRKAPFRLAGAAGEDWRVVMDPQGVVAEVNEGNNAGVVAGKG
jgi:hypothetical protein